MSPRPEKKYLFFAGWDWNVGPLWQTRGMEETCLSATDFRVHLKVWLNQVAEGGAPVVVVRHGFNMGVMIGLREYEEFKRWKRRNEGEVVVPDDHPDNLPTEEIEKLYSQTAGATDDRTLRWRGRAYLSYKVRTGKYLDPPS